MFDIKNMQINQPIVLSDIESMIFTKQGIISIADVKIEALSGEVDGRIYSDKIFDVKNSTRNKIIYPPDGCIFELKYPQVNIMGKAV